MRPVGVSTSSHLPHGFDALLEQMIIAVHLHVMWPHAVAVDGPELLHGAEPEPNTRHRSGQVSTKGKYRPRLEFPILFLVPENI